MEPPSVNDPGPTGNIFAVDPHTEPAAPDWAVKPIPEGRRVDAGRGLTWITAAWQMFKEAPGSWVACFLVFLVIMFALAIVPLLGNIAGALLSPLLIGGLMIGCREQSRGDELEVGHLFAGFKAKSGPLLMLGLIEFGISLVVMMVAAGIIFATAGAVFLGILLGQSPDPGAMLTPGFWLGAATLIVVVMALFIPVTMAVWFAPALVVLEETAPVVALQWSFFACLKNMWSFLVYGVAMLVLAILATIPLGLGWLVLGPVVIASVYTAYRDIFFEAPRYPV